MSLLDTMTDTDILSLRRKNEILRNTLEKQGILNTKLKKMLDLTIEIIDAPSDHQEYYRELEKLVGMSADETHPGEPEATADESDQLDG